MATKQLLTWKLINGIIKPSTETVQHITNWIAKHKNGDILNAQIITPGYARKTQQHKRYWKVVLPVVSFYVDNTEQYVTQKNGKMDFKILHRYLTLKFALENNRPDIITYVPTLHKNEKIMVPIVSESFEQMSQKDMQEYNNWLDGLVFKSTQGKTIDECYMEMSV